MSFDPFGHLSSSSPPAQQPPPDEEYPDQPDNDVRDRVQFPAMFLISISVLNLLVALGFVGYFIYIAVTPADVYYQFMAEQLDKANKTPDVPFAKITQDAQKQLSEMDPPSFKRQSLIAEGLRSIVLATVALLGLIGGVRMYQLRAYSSAMLGSLATAVPCLSPMTCCCGIGELVALWCVMILLLPSVREAFR